MFAQEPPPDFDISCRREPGELPGTDNECPKDLQPKGCRGSPRRDHPWWFDVMHGGERWRMRVDEFALLRGAAQYVTSKQTAERVWEPTFLGEIMAGGDPRIAPTKPDTTSGLTRGGVSRSLPDHLRGSRRPQSAGTVLGHVKALKASLGSRPVTALEKPADISRFKAEYRQGRKLATVNRALGVLRAAINWGRFQDPPLLSTTPLHRFGVTIKARDETKRDRRVHRDEEQRLLAACVTRTQPSTMRRASDARSHHRRPRNVLPPGRDAASSSTATSSSRSIRS
jgi:hypothetical protein